MSETEQLREELQYAHAAIDRLDAELSHEEQQIQLYQMKVKARDLLIERLAARIDELEWRLGLEELASPPPALKDAFEKLTFGPQAI